MIDFVVGIEDAKLLFANLGMIGIQINRYHGQLVVARSPGDVRAIRANAGPATSHTKVYDSFTFGFNQQVGVFIAHPGVDRSGNPLSVGRIT